MFGIRCTLGNFCSIKYFKKAFLRKKSSLLITNANKYYILSVLATYMVIDSAMSHSFQSSFVVLRYFSYFHLSNLNRQVPDTP